MAKDKPEELSRRDFIGLALGSVLVAGIGCTTESNTSEPSGAGGTPGGNGGTPSTDTKETEPSEGGGSGSTTTKNGKGGSTSSSTGKNSSATGGTSSKSDSSAEGGAEQTGGSSSSSKSSGNSGSSNSSKSSSSGGSSGSKSASGSSTGGTSASPQGGTSSTSTTGSTGAPYVAMVRGTDWVQATMDAIALVGGLPDLSGKTVLLKPNLITKTPNYSTSKDVIHGVIKAVKEKNAAKIIVADSSWGANKDVIANMDALGISAICEAEGAEAVDLQNDPHTTRNGVDFSDLVYGAGYVINIPVCKNHQIAKFTMALKNWYGCTESGRSHTNWKAAADLRKIRQEDFVVLDATKTVTTQGPDSGTVVQSKIVVASKDPIAVDVTGLCIHKYSGGTLIADAGEPWILQPIVQAMALKLPGWLTSRQEFEYAQQGVTEHADIMKWR